MPGHEPETFEWDELAVAIVESNVYRAGQFAIDRMIARHMAGPGAMAGNGKAAHRGLESTAAGTIGEVGRGKFGGNGPEVVIEAGLVGKDRIADDGSER